MKHFICILLTLCAVVYSQQASAQSLDDLMRGLSSLFSTQEPASETPKDVYPPLDELFGRFKYDALAIDYSGDSTLAALAVSTLEGQLALIAEKAGFVVGRDYVDVTDDGTMVIVRDGHKAQAYCSSYDNQTGKASIMMNIGEQSLYITTTVTKIDSRYRLMFDATELFALMAKHYSKFQ
ncbi:MAG: DUF4923 family protein, partial [Rikenellaceae bacterium]|nr:DUF4923 family protein [Rikenellaceae bacterium]